MTKEDIIRMAQESGFCFNIDDPVVYAAHEHLAALHAAHEREQCAQLLERTDLSALKNDIGLQVWLGKMIMGFAEAIRARGEK